MAAGADVKDVYLSFQEFFEKLGSDPSRWGKPFAALLGGLDAQLSLECASIGGKDSMSGSFMDLDVPPTLISFAVSPANASQTVTGEFKQADRKVVLFAPHKTQDLFAYGINCKKTWEIFTDLVKQGKIAASWALDAHCAEGIAKMSFGNRIGFAASAKDFDFFEEYNGAIIAELCDGISIDGDCFDIIELGVTQNNPVVDLANESVSIDELYAINDGVLTGVYPTHSSVDETKSVEAVSYHGQKSIPAVLGKAHPKALIPVFPGTNCEYDSARALMSAGIDPEIMVIKNLSASDVARSVSEFADALGRSDLVFIPGGFSGGDEPDGSAKFITAFFRNPAIKEQVGHLMDNRGGLMLGICNGFQALIKLGLVPYGKIIDTDADCPTLTFNSIGRHQSKLVRTRICSTASPWLSGVSLGDIYTVAVSHGEGRFIASDSVIKDLITNGQIATQYVDMQGNPTMDTTYNPNGSMMAIEGLLSPDGRILGKMGHSERIGKLLYRNVPGQYDMKLFESAAKYFGKQ
ncbi:MAG: phosphoribosylformylglycinamidine synthase subunit PurQ [Eggerthellaceae bacterium]|nr:phosphoribosylformylglycinamidine synthase subunit PurQ [Eggerthellaceae bacterium]